MLFCFLWPHRTAFILKFSSLICPVTLHFKFNVNVLYESLRLNSLLHLNKPRLTSVHPCAVIVELELYHIFDVYIQPFLSTWLSVVFFFTISACFFFCSWCQIWLRWHGSDRCCFCLFVNMLSAPEKGCFCFVKCKKYVNKFFEKEDLYGANNFLSLTYRSSPHFTYKWSPSYRW